MSDKRFHNQLDLTLGHYTSAYDVVFLDKFSSGDVIFTTIGRLIDKCSDFKGFKDWVGDNKIRQWNAVIEAWKCIVYSPCIGLNVYDAVEYVANERPYLSDSIYTVPW